MILALLSQYACGHMSFLTVRIVGNINKLLTACILLTLDAALIEVLGPTVTAGEAVTDKQTDRQTDGQTDGNVGNIYGFTGGTGKF